MPIALLFVVQYGASFQERIDLPSAMLIILNPLFASFWMTKLSILRAFDFPSSISIAIAFNTDQSLPLER